MSAAARGMVSRLTVAAVGVVGVVVAACSASVAGYPIATGICNACHDTAFTADECAAFGRAANCITVEVVDPSIEGCVNACSFEHCKTPISCGGSSGGPDGPPGGPAPCGINAAGGIFLEAPSCPEPREVTLGLGTVDETKAFVCLCESGCPCDLSCGVISEVDPDNAIYCTTPTK